jgi:tetratricopeptide (TPR) repeat protein
MADRVRPTAVIRLSRFDPHEADIGAILYAVGNFEKMRSVCEGSNEGVSETDPQHCLALA